MRGGKEDGVRLTLRGGGLPAGISKLGLVGIKC